MNLNEQGRNWTTHTAPEFRNDTERKAYNELRGILLVHPAEMTAADYRRIRELAATLEKCKREAHDSR